MQDLWRGVIYQYKHHHNQNNDVIRLDARSHHLLKLVDSLIDKDDGKICGDGNTICFYCCCCNCCCHSQSILVILVVVLLSSCPTNNTRSVPTHTPVL
jgi:hypothetical protein